MRADTSMQNLSLGQSVSNLWAWLHTWEDDAGGIHGPVVYHHRDNLTVLRPDTWTQGATILGLLNAHDASANTQFLDAATRLGRFLMKNYISELHVYRDSNFDQKPLGRPALEGNAIASFSLLNLARAAGPTGKDFERTADDNVREFIVKQWDSKGKAFAVTYHGEGAHIHNKGAMAILAILACENYRVDGEMTREYAIPAGEFILDSQVKEGEFAGAFPYADNDNNYRTLYSLVTGMGLLGLHRVTGVPKYLESVERLVNHLSRFVDQETGLICHYHRVGYPQWITDTILYHMISKAAKDIRGALNSQTGDAGLLKVLPYQYPSGAFPLSLGFEDLWYRDVMKARPEIRRWRDILPTPGLNSWNFWFLSSFLKQGSPIPPPRSLMPHTISSDREEREGPYEITDSQDEVRMKALPGGQLRLVISKCDDVPILCEIRQRTSYWRTLDSIMRYPEPLRRLILAAPRLWLKLRR